MLFKSLLISLFLRNSGLGKLVLRDPSELNKDGKLDAERIRQEADLVSTSFRKQDGCEEVEERVDIFAFTWQENSKAEVGEGEVSLVTELKHVVDRRFITDDTTTGENADILIQDRPYLNCLEADDPRLLEALQSEILSPPSQLPYNFTQDPPNQLGEYLQGLYLDLVIFKGKTGGFFVELGLGDFEALSNTLLLEMKYGWSGLIIEPHPVDYVEGLLIQRKVWSANSCLSSGSRPVSKQVQCFPFYSFLLALETRTLNYLSVKLAAEELPVIQSIPWDKVDIEVISVETQVQELVYEGSQDKIISFLDSKGYEHVATLHQEDIFIRRDLMHGHYAPNMEIHELLKGQEVNKISDILDTHPGLVPTAESLRSWLGVKMEL